MELAGTIAGNRLEEFHVLQSLDENLMDLRQGTTNDWEKEELENRYEEPDSCKNYCRRHYPWSGQWRWTD